MHTTQTRFRERTDYYIYILRGRTLSIYNNMTSSPGVQLYYLFIYLYILLYYIDGSFYRDKNTRVGRSGKGNKITTFEVPLTYTNGRVRVQTGPPYVITGPRAAEHGNRIRAQRLKILSGPPFSTHHPLYLIPSLIFYRFPDEFF